MGTSEKRIDACAGGTEAAGAWENTKLEGLFLVFSLQAARRDVAIWECSFSAEHL
jgi:hypothetical protein